MKLACFFFISALVAAQSAFEVASVRQTPPGSVGFSISPPGAATFTARSVTLEILISMAYGIDGDRISSKR
ncbi:MAG TPA: hypothetical protein VMT15_01245 [Bryobacteraceae bacterium]|nr:hypothetical protein [Bryobacteraceae bacterium]